MDGQPWSDFLFATASLSRFTRRQANAVFALIA
jgi:hypothetical protein